MFAMEKPNDPLKHSRLKEKLKETLFNLANSNPDKPLTPSQIALIEKGLLHTFSSLKTPTHPAYAWMIQDAIKDLDEEDRLTTEEMISEYIVKKYEGLPWAHKRYLKHHLDKLCEIGDLIYDIDGSYIFPDQKMRKSLRRKLIKRKLLSKKKEDVVEEVKLARWEVNELSDTHAAFQDVPQELGRGKRNRRRPFIVDEEEDEVVETRVVVGKGNRDSGSGSEMVVIETQNEVLLLEGGEVECRISEEDHGLDDIVYSKEVKNHDLSEGRKDLEMLELPQNVTKILPVVTEGEAMKLDDSHGDNLMRVPVESVNESNLVSDLMRVPVKVDPLASVSNIESDAIGSTVEKSVLKESEPNPSASELMIVPYVDDPMNSPTGKLMIPLSKSVDPIVVCGLPNQKLEQEKKKIQVYLTRRRSKTPQEKTKALREEPMLASRDLYVQRSPETKLKGKSQSPKLKGLPLLEDGSVEQLEKQKSSHPIRLESFSMEDEEPLPQVIKKCGNLKKHGMQGAMLKVASALASPKAGEQLPKELPSLDSAVEMTPTLEKESALTKNTENQLHMELRSQVKSCDNVEEDTSRKLSSSLLEESGTKDSEGTENQKPKILGLDRPPKAAPPPDCPFKEVSSSQSLDGLGDQADRTQLQVSDHNLQAPKATLEQGTKSALDGCSESLIEGPNLQCPEKPSNLMETSEGLTIPSLLEELHQQEEGPSEQTGHSQQEKPHVLLITKSNQAELSSQLFEHQMEDNEAQSQHVVKHQNLEMPEVTFVNRDDQEMPLKVIEATPEDEACFSDLHSQMREGLSELASHQHSHHQLNKQLKNSQQQKRKRGRPLKSEKSTMIDVADSLLDPDSTTRQFSDNKNKQLFYQRKLIKEKLAPKDVSPSSLHLHEQEGKERATQKDGQVRTRKQRATQKDAAALLDPQLKEQEGLSGTEISRDLENQNMQVEKAGQGRPRKSKEAVMEAMDSSSFHLQEQQGPDPATGWHCEQQNKHLKKDGRGRRRKQKDKAAEYGTYFRNLQQKKGMSEPATCSRGRPKKKNKKNKVTEEHLAASLKLNHQQEVGLSESVNNQQYQDQNKKVKKGRPKTKKAGDKDDEALLSLSHEEQCPEKVEFESASHVIPEASSIQSQVDLKESLPATSDHISHPDLELSAMEASEASTCLADQSIQRHKDQNQPRRRSARNSGAAKTFSESQNDKQHDLENEVHGKPVDLEQAKRPLGDKTHQQGQLPPSTPVTTLSNNQHDQEQPEESHDHDQAREKMEVQMKLSKEMTPKSASIHVPLSSKDQLRSRIKRQSQDSA